MWQRLFAWRPHVAARPAFALAAACATVFCAFLLKGPEVVTPQVTFDTNDIDQAERVIDDMEMLKQLGTLSRPEDPESSKAL